MSCIAGGKWSSEAPLCKFVDCGTPPLTENLLFRLMNATTTVGSIVQYSCKENYWITGRDTQQCSKDGKWSADVPTCECKFHDHTYIAMG